MLSNIFENRNKKILLNYEDMPFKAIRANKKTFK